MAQNSRLWREISLHGINALGVCLFVGFMRHWPRFYDSGPPVDWQGLVSVMVPDGAWLYLPVLFLDGLPALVFSRRRGGVADYALQPFCGAVILGLAAVVIFYFNAASRGEHDPVFSAQNARMALLFFFLHFVPILVFETIVRALWLSATRRSQGGATA